MNRSRSLLRPQQPTSPRMAGFQVLEVLRTADVSPWLKRITFGGDEFARMKLDGTFVGPHVKILIPPPHVDRPQWPTRIDGRIVWPPEERRPLMRTYSVRRFDPDSAELDIDFVLHGDEGVASRWAADARPGDIAGIWGPGGRGPASPVDWYLFGGDLTAIPAITFALEGLPRDTKGKAVIEVDAESQILPVDAPAGVELIWIRAGKAGNRLFEAMTALLPPEGGRPFVWAGAEASIARRLRGYFRSAEGFDRANCYILNYWKRGMAEGSFGYSE